MSGDETTPVYIVVISISIFFNIILGTVIAVIMVVHRCSMYKTRKECISLSLEGSTSTGISHKHAMINNKHATLYSIFTCLSIDNVEVLERAGDRVVIIRLQNKPWQFMTALETFQVSPTIFA